MPSTHTASTWSSTSAKPDPLATAALHVVAGVLLDPAGRVLLAQRPPGKHLAGMWEFPGGKLDPDEAPVAGLARELHEELDIRVDTARATPLVQVLWNYGERTLLLDAWRVGRWQGTPDPWRGRRCSGCGPGRWPKGSWHRRIGKSCGPCSRPWPNRRRSSAGCNDRPQPMTAYRRC